MKPVKIFIVYSREDESIKKELLNHLESLKRTGDIETWDDSQIMIGDEWDASIKTNLNEAKIIFMLVSSDSIASKYINEVELKRSLEKAKSGEAILIPIIIRHCLWSPLEIGNYQALPKDGIPITDNYWGNRDKAYLNIVEELAKLIKNKKEDIKLSKEESKFNDSNGRLLDFLMRTFSFKFNYIWKTSVLLIVVLFLYFIIAFFKVEETPSVDIINKVIAELTIENGITFGRKDTLIDETIDKYFNSNATVSLLMNGKASISFSGSIKDYLKEVRLGQHKNCQVIKSISRNHIEFACK